MLLVARSYDWHRKCHCEVWRFSKNMNEQTVKVRLKSVLYLLVFWGMNVQLVPEKVLPPLEYWVYFVSGIVIHVLIVWLGLGTKMTWSRSAYQIVWTQTQLKIVLKSFSHFNKYVIVLPQTWQMEKCPLLLKISSGFRFKNVQMPSHLITWQLAHNVIVEYILYITLVLSTFYSVGWV